MAEAAHRHFCHPVNIYIILKLIELKMRMTLEKQKACNVFPSK